MIDIKSMEEFNKLVNNSKSLIIDFYANWCGPCKKLGEYFHSIENVEKYNEVVFAKINVDNEEFENLCTTMGVSGIPHVLYYKAGSKVSETVGYDIKEINDNLEKIMN